jgi:hypothetical protein
MRPSEEQGEHLVITTTCELYRGQDLAGSGETVDSTAEPFFVRILDRLVNDPQRGPRWIAERIVAGTAATGAQGGAGDQV